MSLDEAFDASLSNEFLNINVPSPNNMGLLADTDLNSLMEHMELQSQMKCLEHNSSAEDPFLSQCLDLDFPFSGMTPPQPSIPQQQTKGITDLLGTKEPPTITYSPTPPKKKTRMSIDEPAEEFLAANSIRVSSTSPTMGSKMESPRSISRSGEFGNTFLSPTELEVNADAFSSDLTFGANYSYGQQTSPNGTYQSQMPKGRKIPAKLISRPAIQSTYANPAAANVAPRVVENAVPTMDANYAKVQLMEMGYPFNKKDPKAFCSQVVSFISTYCSIRVGGFYINNNNSLNPATSWILTCSYPSQADFNQYFHYNVGERFIVQAALEKRCFCVHSSSWENNSSLLSFLFVPIPNEQSSGNALAVMVLGTVLTREEELHSHLLFLDQVRKPIASILRTLLQIQHSLYVLQKVDFVSSDGEVRKQSAQFEKVLVSILGNKFDEDYPIIGTNTKGLISYVSPSALKMLGYVPEELCGRLYLHQLYNLQELCEYCHEIEVETGKVFPADFNLIIYRTVHSRGSDDIRNWSWLRKDGTYVKLKLTVRPLNDDSGVVGFVFFSKEV